MQYCFEPISHQQIFLHKHAILLVLFPISWVMLNDDVGLNVLGSGSCSFAYCFVCYSFYEAAIYGIERSIGSPTAVVYAGCFIQ